MSDLKKSISFFSLFLVASVYAWELPEGQLPHGTDQFQVISQTGTAISTAADYVQTNGTVTLYGNEAKSLSQEAEREVAEQAANVPLEPGMVTFVQRGPAITEVGPSQRIGEVLPENYPSFIAPPSEGGSEEALNENPFDKVGNVTVGNAGKVFDTVKPLGLPLPIATVTGSKDVPQKGVQVDPDQRGTALGIGSEGSSFGQMKSDQSFQNLIRPGSKSKDSAQDEKLQKELASLADKNKKQEEQNKDKKSPEEIQAAKEKLMSAEPEYDYKTYEDARDLLYENPSLNEGADSDFGRKMKDIFGAKQGLDKGEDTELKKLNFQEFVGKVPEGKGGKDPLFPATPLEPSNRIRDNSNHKF